jgi:hypothetical protein
MARKDSYILGPKDTAITTQPLPANPSGPAIIALHLEANLALVIGPVKIFGLGQADQLQLTRVIAKESTNMPLGKKKANDACTRKVKARYTVWPSAYASGALVRCRKVGAKNWGNKGNK